MALPYEMQQYLAEKYRQSGMVAAAQAAQARAGANLTNQQASVVRPAAEAAIGVDKANAGFTNTQNDWYGKKTQSEINLNNANANQSNASAGFTDTQRQYYGLKTTADAFQSLQAGNLNGASAVAVNNGQKPLQGSLSRGVYDKFQPVGLGDLGGLNFGLSVSAPPPSITAPLDAVGGSAPAVTIRKSGMPSLLDLPSLVRRSIFDDGGSSLSGGRVGFKRGTARVPGKGAGDKVPANLEPGEAVLNKHAADMIGRDKIAKANAKGNAKRKDQESLKVAQMIKEMMSGMV